MRLRWALAVLLLLGCTDTIYSSPTDSTGSKETKYEVKAHDTWYSIARLYDISYAELRMANKDADDKLFPGKILIIPGKAKVNDPRYQKNYPDQAASTTTTSKPASPPTKPKKKKITHTISTSETLYSIAKYYEVSVDDIKKWNHLKSEMIQPGQELKIKNALIYSPPKPKEALIAGNGTNESASTSAKPVDEVAMKDESKNETVPVSVVAAKPSTVIKSKSDSAFAFAKNRKEVTEHGVASWIDDDAINPKKYFALHRTAPTGTIIKITNKMNGQSLFVKVVGKLPDTGDNDGLIIKISKAGAEKLGVLDQRFTADIMYGVADSTNVIK